MGTVRTYHEGKHCGHCMHHLYAQSLGAKCLSPWAAINILVTPSHCISAINVWVDAATTEEPQADLTWSRPYSFGPLLNFADHCHLVCSDLQEWLRN